MNEALLASIIQGGAFALLTVVLVFVGQGIRALMVQQNKRIEDNVNFTQKIIDELNTERKLHMDAWRAITTELIEAQQGYTQALEEYTKAFGILKNTISADHTKLLRSLEKEDI